MSVDAERLPSSAVEAAWEILIRISDEKGYDAAAYSPDDVAVAIQGFLEAAEVKL